jgi:hypothetical protein
VENTMKKVALRALSVLAVAALACAYTLNPDGTGFVSKGEVQTAFGWNNALLQKNASGVTFRYDTAEEYKYDCTFTVEVGKDKVREPRTQNRGKSTSVNAVVAYDARIKNQVTGFTLTSFTSSTSSGEVPVDGGSCPGGQFNDGVISNVELVSSSGGLYASHSGVEVLLP